MSDTNRILVPTNFSLSAEKTYEFARTLASKFNLLIDLIHVLPASVYLDEKIRRSNKYSNLKEKLIRSESNEAEKQLKKAMTEYIPDKNRGDFYLKSGSYPSEIINTHVSEGSYTMIIMSTQEKDYDKYRSNITEQVIRRSKIPVMILTDNTNIKEIKSILVPTDGSLLSMTAIPSAVLLANMFNARITMLYVNEAYGLFTNHFSTKSHKNVNNEMIQYLFNRIHEFFKTQSKKYELLTDDNFRNPRIRIGKQEKTIPLRMKIITGLSAHDEITKFANRSADFVVMATHGRSGLAQLFMGSVAEKVAQNIEKPILTIRPESKLFTRVQAEAGVEG